MARKSINTKIDQELYRKIKVLAAKLDKNAYELLEEGMKLVLEKHGEQP